MTEPKNGDFASVLNHLVNQPEASKPVLRVTDDAQTQDEPALDDAMPEFLFDEHQKLSEELMREAAELDAVEPLSEDELERQALQAGGSDDDASTPE